MDPPNAAVLKELRQIPGVGKSIAIDLWELGIRRVADLQNRDPQALYDRLCEMRGMHIDRCMLYVLRCAVYYASTFPHEPDKLLWWNWKDTAMERRTGAPLR
ncbi:MAG TPA: helix-hairpin-helix domain-containing protein [Longimicrobium sp.]|jgi:hypothetical protein